MHRSILIPTVLALIVFLCTSMTPRKAQANFTDGLLIGAYTTAGVAVVTIAAILLAPRDEPDFLDFMPPDHKHNDLEKKGFRFGTACRMSDGTVATVCW